MPEKPQDDPRVYFAAERTFLAWIRTGLGLMGVGFAVSRFGLFLRQMSAERNQMPVHTTHISVWSGVALVALGVLVNLSAVARHLRGQWPADDQLQQRNRLHPCSALLGRTTSAACLRVLLIRTVVAIREWKARWTALPPQLMA